eukprot:1942732-Pyramimonas_sp.AAC.3
MMWTNGLPMREIGWPCHTVNPLPKSRYEVVHLLTMVDVVSTYTIRSMDGTSSNDYKPHHLASKYTIMEQQQR